MIALIYNQIVRAPVFAFDDNQLGCRSRRMLARSALSNAASKERCPRSTEALSPTGPFRFSRRQRPHRDYFAQVFHERRALFLSAYFVTSCLPAAIFQDWAMISKVKIVFHREYALLSQNEPKNGICLSTPLNRLPRDLLELRTFRLFIAGRAWRPALLTRLLGSNLSITWPFRLVALLRDRPCSARPSLLERRSWTVSIFADFAKMNLTKSGKL